MRARVKLTSVGPGATIQDAGRFGWLRYGVTPAGPMDWVACQTVNRALGNDPGAAALEIGLGGLSLTVDAPLTLAFAGGAFQWRRDRTDLPPAARLRLFPGEVLSVRPGPGGAFTYIAVPGGFDVPEVLGSRATHTRSRLGGMEGRMLRGGDELAIAGAPGLPGDDAIIAAPWLSGDDTPIRVVPGPQDDHFTPESRARFLREAYTLTAIADRMAYKLAGPRLDHAGDFNIVSDGVALGAIQVAGDGQPMVLMADRQPTGGYPKIAHVCRADIGRLAQLRPGDSCRFAAITSDEARARLVALEDEVAGTAGAMIPLRLEPSAERLFGSNLISGVVDAHLK